MRPLILLFCFICSFHCGLQAQSGLQHMDENILERLAAGRTGGQTRLWRFLSDANTPVDIAIPIAVLADGLIENDSRTKRNALYIAGSTATTYLLNLPIKQLVRRPGLF
jgi:undecaprenyl-diphosphatase